MDYRISKASLYRNPFIGIHLRACSREVLVPREIPPLLLQSAEAALGVPAVKISISQSNLLGLFAAMNSNGAVVPSFIEEAELSHLKKSAGLNVAVMSSHFAVGNNILCNDRAALANPAYSKAEIAQISDALGVETVAHDTLTRIPTIGAISVATNRGLLAYNDMPQVELRKLERFFGVKGAVGTCNMGVPFNGIGVVANDNRALVGDASSGFETQRIYEALSG